MISNHAPLRKTRKRELKFQSKPWITSGLKKSTVIKNKLFGKLTKSANSVIKEKLHNDYKSYINIISTLLKQSQKKKKKKTMLSILKIISITSKIPGKELDP